MTFALLVALALADPAAQDQKALPAFPSRVEVVTLDVVVVDKQGRPVRGLVAADFAVSEEGRPQVVVAFEAVEPAAGASEHAAQGAASVAPGAGRAFVFVVDDLALDPVRGVPVVKKAIGEWLVARSAPTDEVTILNTNGDLLRSGRVGSGREDLLAVLDKIQGRKPLERAVMTEWQAWAISEGAPGSETLAAQLAQRALSARTCFSSRDCTSFVKMAARQIHDRTGQRAGALLGSIERASGALAPLPGRKSIVILSEGFVRGTQGQEEAALRASQQANTAVYLVDARGLRTDPAFLAETDEAPNSLGALSPDGTFPANQDGDYLAEATGGFALRNTNDLTAGLGRILDESKVYYRLGYQPEKAPDGRWRKLNVKVRRRRVEVRARRGYYASPTTTVADAALTEGNPEGEGPADLPNPPAAAAQGEPARLPDHVLATVLEKAGAYVEDYGQAFRDVVAEETYTQSNVGHRQLSRSDLVFVSIPGAIPWTCFRDVFEVDGLGVRERESRLEKLFLAEPRASALKKADAIIVESAHYNLGARRTINVPTLPLLFLHPENQSRFRFERKGSRRFGDREAVEIAFAELESPTLVNDGRGGDVTASGRIFVDPRDGVVLRTEASFIHPRAIGQIVVEYRFDRELGIWLPAQMQEGYRNPQRALFDTEATARYAKYRRFGVTTEERVALPPK